MVLSVWYYIQTAPFQLYDIPMTKVEAMEKMCSKFVQKWLGVPPSFSSVNLKSKTSQAPLTLFISS